MVWPDPQALSRWPWRAGEARRRRRAVKHRGVQWPGVRGATEGGGVEGWWAASGGVTCLAHGARVWPPRRLEFSGSCFGAVDSRLKRCAEAVSVDGQGGRRGRAIQAAHYNAAGLQRREHCRPCSSEAVAERQQAGLPQAACHQS